MKKHCNLCDNQILSLEEGVLCGLTNKKPSFNSTCLKIDFNSNLLNLLEDTLIEYEDLKLSKNKVYKNLVYGSIIGVLLMVFGYFIFKHFLNIGYIAYSNSSANLLTVPGIILVAGYYFISQPIKKLSNYKKQLLTIENNISEIEEVLNLYNQKYKYNINFDKVIHGIQEVQIDLELI